MKKFTIPIALAYPGLLLAQGGPPPPGLPDEPEILPLNSFEEVLLFAAILLAGLAVRKIKKETAGSSKNKIRPSTSKIKTDY